DWKGAFVIEETIQAALGRITTGRWQLTYINSLNMARLYRRRGDFDAAQRSYREAFATSFGTWSDSDAIYANVCAARVHEARRWYASALHAWGRAALYWVSSAVPEAIARRVTRTILGSAQLGSGASEGNIIDDLSVAFRSRLITNATAAGLDRERAAMECADSNRAPAFVRPDAL